MRRLFSSISVAIPMFLAFWLTPVAAQEHKGAVTGQVTDAGHGVLKGATVELQPAGKPTVTDSQGQFTISDLAPGEYILTISYVGLDPFSKKITVTAGQITRVEA